MSYHPPFYKRYPRDYLSSSATRRMTLAEHGIYNKLLDYAWLEERTATLPKDLSILAKLTGIDRRILCKFTVKFPRLFCEVPGDSQRIYNPRMKAEYEKFLEHIESKRHAGIISGKVRKAKRTGVRTELNNKDTELDLDVRKEQTPSAASAQVASNPNELETKEAAFKVFWEVWPLKQSKATALRVWMKIPISEYVPIMAGLAKWRKSDQWERGVIPHPATWLNQSRWQDEDIPEKGPVNGNHSAAAVKPAAVKYAAIPITRATA
jgi:uncharacterized protein YdaU (DUF1376 family)